MSACAKSAPARPAEANPEAGAAVLKRFAEMVPNAYAYAHAAREAGRPVVGILCEYTPRELILAAGGVPVCLCGGDARKIPIAEEVLPANLCPLVKSTYGYLRAHANPFLEMADLIVAETTCDAKKKMYELLARDKTVRVLELPQKPDEPRAFEHWLGELRALREFLGARYGVEVTDERLRDAIRAMNRERRLRRELAGLMRADAPPLTGRELLDLKSLISTIPEDLDAYERAWTAWRGGPGRPELAGRTRVLLTGVPVPHMAERVVDLIEAHGGLIVAMENCTGLKPILDDVDEADPDPLAAIARKYWSLPCSVMTPNRARFDLLRSLAKEYRVAAVVDLVWQACLTYDIESRLVRELVENEWGLPYLRIETDYSPSDSSRIILRVEALFEAARARGGVSRA